MIACLHAAEKIGTYPTTSARRKRGEGLERRDDSARRTELAAFLRARRAELRPEDVGLPPSRRRRVPGLRRDEVAGLAAISVAWYTQLEQAREINPTAQVLDALADGTAPGRGRSSPPPGARRRARHGTQTRARRRRPGVAPPARTDVTVTRQCHDRRIRLPRMERRVRRPLLVRPARACRPNGATGSGRCSPSALSGSSRTATRWPQLSWLSFASKRVNDQETAASMRSSRRSAARARSSAPCGPATTSIARCTRAPSSSAILVVGRIRVRPVQLRAVHQPAVLVSVHVPASDVDRRLIDGTSAF